MGPFLPAFAGALVLLCTMLSCASRTLPVEADTTSNSHNDVAVNSDTFTDFQDTDDFPVAPTKCVVGTWVDSCCPAAVPVTREQVEQEPCLVRYPAEEDVPSVCIPGSCDDVDCDLPVTPPVRSAALDDTGKCTLVSECDDLDDCVIATDHDKCCACPRAYPIALVRAERCLVEEGDEVPADCSEPCPDTCGPCKKVGRPACATPLKPNPEGRYLSQCMAYVP